MSKKWMKIAVITGVGLVGIAAVSIYHIAQSIRYEVLSYQIQYLDNEAVTIRIWMAVTNPFPFNVEISNQKYDVYVAGYETSTITSYEKFTLFADNTSPISFDIKFEWDIIEKQLAPILTQSTITNIDELPVIIKGRLAGKSGPFRLSGIPIRVPGKLGWFLP